MARIFDRSVVIKRPERIRVRIEICLRLDRRRNTFQHNRKTAQRARQHCSRTVMRRYANVLRGFADGNTFKTTILPLNLSEFSMRLAREISGNYRKT